MTRPKTHGTVLSCFPALEVVTLQQCASEKLLKPVRAICNRTLLELTLFPFILYLVDITVISSSSTWCKRMHYLEHTVL